MRRRFAGFRERCPGGPLLDRRHWPLRVLHLRQRGDDRQSRGRPGRPLALPGVRRRPDRRQCRHDRHRYADGRHQDPYKSSEHRLPTHPGHRRLPVLSLIGREQEESRRSGLKERQELRRGTSVSRAMTATPGARKAERTESLPGRVEKVEEPDILSSSSFARLLSDPICQNPNGQQNGVA